MNNCGGGDGVKCTRWSQFSRSIEQISTYCFTTHGLRNFPACTNSTTCCRPFLPTQAIALCVIYPLQPISTQIPIRRTSNLDWAFYRSKAKLCVNGFLPWYHQQTASSVLIITPTKLVTRIRDAIKTLVETMINRIANAMSSLLLITASDGGCSIRINCWRGTVTKLLIRIRDWMGVAQSHRDERALWPSKLEGVSSPVSSECRASGSSDGQPDWRQVGAAESGKFQRSPSKINTYAQSWSPPNWSVPHNQTDHDLSMQIPPDASVTRDRDSARSSSLKNNLSTVLSSLWPRHMCKFSPHP